MQAAVAVRQPATNTVTVEAVVNGFPVATRTIPADGRTQVISMDVPIVQSSWVALRTYPSAHSNPIYVVVEGKPLRASRRSAEWCLRGVDQCWSQKERFYVGEERQEAIYAYDHARAIYRRILSECKTE